MGDGRRAGAFGGLLGVVLAALAAEAASADINISQFVFRDADRNGIYDRGESAFAGVRVELRQDGRDPVRRDSNLAGFANFPMSTDPEEEPDIGAPGRLQFSVVVPEGFVLTTANPEQETEARLLEGSLAGIVIDPPLPFVGLAPALVIETPAEGVAQMRCSGPGGARIAETREGVLACPVTAGVWDVEWRMTDGITRRRSVKVADWPVMALPGLGAGSEGPDYVEAFDDWLSTQNIVEMASRDDFVWHNFVVVHRKFYGGWGYLNGTISGQYAAYNSSGHPARVESEAPFDFRGVFVSVAWPGGMRAPVRFRAYRGGDLVGEAAFRASNMAPVWFDPGWTGIDALEVLHDRYWQVVLDDMTFAR